MLIFFFIVKNDNNLVPIDEFGNILKWFGPMVVSEEPENNFIYRVSFFNPWALLIYNIDAEFIDKEMVSWRYYT